MSRGSQWKKLRSAISPNSHCMQNFFEQLAIPNHRFQFFYITTVFVGSATIFYIYFSFEKLRNALCRNEPKKIRISQSLEILLNCFFKKHIFKHNRNRNTLGYKLSAIEIQL